VSTVARGIVFAAAALMGLASALYLSNRQSIDSYLHTSNLQVQDWALWFFGIGLVAYCLFSLVRRGGVFDWRWPMWLILGATMIYAEWFNVVPLKELTCRVLRGSHHPVSAGPCYKTD